MRQRMIKTEFFSSESMADCSPWARLLFIGLWCCAKDDGALVFAPRSIKKDLFGLDDMSMEEFYGYFAELEQVGCIRFYTDGNQVYIDIPNFTYYQTISHPQPSNLPSRSSSVPVTFHTCSMNVPPKQLINQLIKQAGDGGGDADAAAPSLDYSEFYKGGLIV